MMNSKLYKIFTGALMGFMIFSACEDEKEVVNVIEEVIVNNGDIVGSWNLISLKGTYARSADMPAGVDSMNKTAYWKNAAALGLPAETGAVPLFTLKQDYPMPGFPQVASYDKATLAAFSIAMTLTAQDAASVGLGATYTLKGTYPTTRLDEINCRTAGTVAPIDDQGLYYVNKNTRTGVVRAGNFSIAPDINLGDQVLPPFPDGTYNVADSSTLTISFYDRDAHDVLYAQVKDTWTEATDRGSTGIFEMPVDATTGAFAATGTSAAEGYVQSPLVASWGGYFTFYTLVYGAEVQYLTALLVAGALTLPDVDGVPGPTAGDFAIYMYSNPTSTTQTGIPYSSIVTPNTDGTPNFTDDSGDEIDVSSPTTGSHLTGGKLTMHFPTGVCFPHNETITFESVFERI
jgi:hypothetical protein